MNAVQQVFEKLTPKGKLLLAVGGTVLVVGTLVGTGMQAGGPDLSLRGAAKPKVEAILTDDDPRGLGLDSLATQMRLLQTQLARLEQLTGQTDKLEQIRTTQDQLSGLEHQVLTLQQDLKRVQQEAVQARALEPAESAESAARGVTPQRTPVLAVSAPAVLNKATSSAADLGAVYANLPPEPPQDPKARNAESKALMKIRVIKSAAAEPPVSAEAMTLTLPAGSILSGVLVTGMDAPTGKQAQRDPFPSLVRIKNEAILPNRFRADFRECFLIAGGWGDMSSERAYLRAERLSCVRSDGAVLEAPLQAYATGEDGKAGVRGRLVSKQGQVLARSLMAGFMQGVASAFDVRQVPSINITRSDNRSGEVEPPVYEQAFSANMLQSAGIGGVGSALERIADFYLEMAESIFPVIEIDAMREVDFIVNKGMTVTFTAPAVSIAGVNP